MEFVNRAVTVGDVLALMWDAPAYQEWSIADVKRCVVPPLSLGQYVAFEDSGQLAGWFSYALLTAEAEEAFASETRKIQPADWNAGDRLWVMDGLAPFGGLRGMCAAMREAVNWCGTVKWLRRDGSARLAWATIGEHNVE